MAAMGERKNIAAEVDLAFSGLSPSERQSRPDVLDREGLLKASPGSIFVLVAVYILALGLFLTGMDLAFNSPRWGLGFELIAGSFVILHTTSTIWSERSASWRVQLIDELCFLANELRRVEMRQFHRAEFQSAEAALLRAHRTIRDHWWSRTAWPMAWVALNEAQEALLMVADVAFVRSQAIELRSALAADGPSWQSPSRAAYDQILAATLDADGISDEQRAAVRGILRAFNRQALLAHEDVRSFNNLQVRIAWAMGLTLALATIIAVLDPTILPVCATDANVTPKCPGGVYATVWQQFDPNDKIHVETWKRFANYDGPWPLDVVYIEVLGAFGGWLWALRTLPKLHRLRMPGGIYVAQAGMKALTGATLAVIGVVAIQRGLVTTYLHYLPPQPGGQIFIFALLFGLAQEPITRILDNRLGSLSQAAASTGPPGWRGSGSTPTRR